MKVETPCPVQGVIHNLNEIAHAAQYDTHLLSDLLSEQRSLQQQ
jgi:hypothetical protein